MVYLIIISLKLIITLILDGSVFRNDQCLIEKIGMNNILFVLNSTSVRISKQRALKRDIYLHAAFSMSFSN